MAANKLTIPSTLKALLPPSVRMFAEQVRFWKIFGLGLAIFIIYGPITGPNIDNNGLRYLTAPLVCPCVAGLLFYLFPPNHYKGYTARIAGLADLDKRDRRAKQFVELFRSKEAHRVIWISVTRVALIEFGALFLLVALSIMTDTITWRVYSLWFWPGLAGGIMGSYIAIGFDLFPWVLREWVETASHLP